MENSYLTKKFVEVYNDLSHRGKKECLNLVYTYIGREFESQNRGQKTKELRRLKNREEKGDQIYLHLIDQKNTEVSHESKAAADQIRAIFTEYKQKQEIRNEKRRQRYAEARELANELNTNLNQWESKYGPDLVKELNELRTTYQGKNSEGKRISSLNSVDNRYKAGNEILVKMIDKNASIGKRSAIKELSEIFGKYEGRIQPKKQAVRDGLRVRQHDLINTMDSVARFYQKPAKPIRPIVMTAKKQRTLTERINDAVRTPTGRAVSTGLAILAAGVLYAGTAKYIKGEMDKYERGLEKIFSKANYSYTVEAK